MSRSRPGLLRLSVVEAEDVVQEHARAWMIRNTVIRPAGRDWTPRGVDKGVRGVPGACVVEGRPDEARAVEVLFSVEHSDNGRDAGGVPSAEATPDAPSAPLFGLVEGRVSAEHAAHGRDAGGAPVTKGLAEG